MLLGFRFVPTFIVTLWNVYGLMRRIIIPYRRVNCMHIKSVHKQEQLNETVCWMMYKFLLQNDNRFFY